MAIINSAHETRRSTHFQTVQNLQQLRCKLLRQHRLNKTVEVVFLYKIFPTVSLSVCWFAFWLLKRMLWFQNKTGLGNFYFNKGDYIDMIWFVFFNRKNLAEIKIMVMILTSGQIKLLVPLTAQRRFALQENEKQWFSYHESVVTGAWRCSWCGQYCNQPSSLASTDARVSALIVGRLCGNPSDMEAMQLEDRLTTHLGLVSRLIASKAKAQLDWVDYQEKPRSDRGNTRKHKGKCCQRSC